MARGIDPLAPGACLETPTVEHVDREAPEGAPGAVDERDELREPAHEQLARVAAVDRDAPLLAVLHGGGIDHQRRERHRRLLERRAQIRSPRLDPDVRGVLEVAIAARSRDGPGVHGTTMTGRAGRFVRDVAPLSRCRALHERDQRTRGPPPLGTSPPPERPSAFAWA